MGRSRLWLGRVEQEEVLAEAVQADGVFLDEAGAGEARGLAVKGDRAGAQEFLKLCSSRRKEALTFFWSLEFEI